MTYKLPLIIIFFSLPIFIFAQNKTSKEIETIIFEGLIKTKETYLEQFIQTKKGAIFSDSLLNSDIQRLKNINSIGSVTYRIEPIEEKVNIIFQLEEVRTLIPIVNFGGIKGNVWFRIGFSDINFLGRGRSLSASYQNNDNRHAGNIYYRVPRFSESNWGFSVGLSRWASREPLYFDEGTVNYDYDNNSLAITAIRHININKNFEFGGTFFIEEYAKSELQFLENPPGPDELTQPKLLTKVEYKENFLNYHLFYLKGIIWQITLQDVYNTLDKSWFHHLLFEGKQYTRIGQKANFAIRLRLGVATNNETPFAPFVADSHVNLRGIGNRIDRGTAQIIFNAEYRQTILESSTWGAQIIAFSDMGTWRNPGGALNDLVDPDQFRHFVGGGVRLIYQKIYGAVIRVDYGIDIFNPNQRGLVIGLGQYF